VRSELQRVLELQPFHNSRKTEPMAERGLLIRHDVPAWLSDSRSDLGEMLGVDDFIAEGGDGTGLKARIPWARFGSRSRAPGATQGFYVVYLFEATGEAVYLSLNQGTTDMIAGDYVRKPAEDLIAAVGWGRSVLGSWLDGLGPDRFEMQLHDRGDLGPGYELGNIASIRYSAGAIPDETALLADARRFAEGLGLIYARHDVEPIPSEQPELREAEEAAQSTAGAKSGKSRVGFRTNAAEIKVIEKHAVAVATAYYEREEFEVEQHGKPFDLKVTKGDETLTVEVKGTTSDGRGVALTAGEVDHHGDAFPANALVVVRNIRLHRDGESPTADSGELYELRKWDIDPNALRVISYAYAVPAEIYDHKGHSSDTLLSDL
jgi:hypothetical protein